MSELGKNVKEKFSEVNITKETNFDLTSIYGVLNMILTAFKLPDPPVEPLPPPLVMFGAPLRPGVSGKEIASRVISRQSEAGLPVGDVFADGPNTAEALLAIQSEEIINALLNESVVNVVIPPGIGVIGFGVTSGGQQVVIQGLTTTMGIGNGIIR
jgi:hypothetical protein